MVIKSMVKEIRKKLDSKEGLKNIYFIGCGGSMAAMYPAFYMIKNEAKEIGTNIFTSNEFVKSIPKSLSEKSICVVCSFKATPETVEAVKVANDRGAITIALTGSTDTGMAKAGKYVLTYTSGADSSQAIALKVSFELLREWENYKNYQIAMEAFDNIGNIIEKALEISLPKAQKFAKEYSDDEVFYVIASGTTYSAGYTMANCYLMEMQWKHAVLVHSGEYFHGPFETTDKKLPIIFYKSIGRTRELDERVERFIDQYAERIIKIDSMELGLDVLDPLIGEYFNSVLMDSITRCYVTEMSKVTGHSMKKRRYMWQFEY